MFFEADHFGLRYFQNVAKLENEKNIYWNFFHYQEENDIYLTSQLVPKYEKPISVQLDHPVESLDPSNESFRLCGH